MITEVSSGYDLLECFASLDVKSLGEDVCRGLLPSRGLHLVLERDPSTVVVT